MTFRERFKKMVVGILTSRKFMVGLPIIVVLIWNGKIPGEWGVVAICALFGINAYEKKERMKNGQPV